MIGMTDFLRGWRGDRSGATAVEFAFVLPIMALLIMGIVSLGLLGGVLSNLHFAVQEAARCSAVNATLCGGPSATVAYARSKFRGGGVAPVFVATGTGCGHTVTANTTFTLRLAVSTIDIPLSATACYPGKPA